MIDAKAPVQVESQVPGMPLIEARGISKRYGSVLANDRVNLRLNGGEVHALLGENGAGKSTLSKILYGFTRPDSGEILVSGKPVELHSPRHARALGIGMVFQNFMLIPALSVLENIALFLTDLPPVVSREAVEKRIREIAERFGLGVDPSAPVRQLSVGDRQKVEILKLLLARARVLILDEPTKVLAPHEVVALFRVFEALKAEGYAILFITHKLREVLACADRIAVMRHGRVAGEFGPGEANMETLVAMMFGEHGADHSAKTAVPARLPPAAAPVLELRGASSRASGSETALRGLDIRVEAGEIVGVAGVSGSGQKELGDLILGLRPLAGGSKWFCGEDASSWSIARMRENGVAFIPEDPLGMAAFPGMSVRENLALGTGRRYWKGATIDWRALESAMTGSFGALAFPVPRLESPMAALSGGNLQRAVVAREMAHKPKLILALYPTRGLDVRSAASLRELLMRARDQGNSVLLISEDLEELAEMADRLLVLFAGAVVGEFRRGAWQAEEVGLLMTGAKEIASV
jgi:general nucleoside transport system ATP-binding protein